MPIYGHAFVGALPSADGRIIGLSKYDRIVDYFAARLQIQEELVKQIGDFLVEKTSPRGLAVRISAAHMCRTHRGVRAEPHGDPGAGRRFTESDLAPGRHVAIVDQTFARIVLNGQDPVGRHVREAVR